MKLACLIGAILVPLSIPVAAQNAAVVGTIRDAQQSVVPGAKITRSNTATGVIQSMDSDAAGNYEFARVRPGTYSLKVEHSGFKTYLQSQIPIEVEQRARVDATLEVG